MDAAIYIPIITEATKFVFSELGKWIGHARQRIGKQPNNSTSEEASDEKDVLTPEEFQRLAKDAQTLSSVINVGVIEMHAYVIKGLVEQLEIHHRNLTDLEGVETEFGALTPLHVKRGIEREANAILEKSERLTTLVSQVYGKTVKINA
jgi:hypothetical protein